ncbi:MAG: ABC transporter substrate-binding protein [Dictyoglomus thermophilum]|uniref:ABC transporter substrate-binding protein n=1 Tax=Dictyoglomus thermophilum TaxID=14 RepID=A0A7V4DY99_DICTH|nr:ABC transporter substrate-binding protein [Dictyoglomus thermophilum]MCX7720684.1 ABC transporter substrate-binding protein [Dictyoglomus thermophilum]TYT24178.1 ABC transporter substrate-binding protein [Dictyoglomus thermophilum]
MLKKISLILVSILMLSLLIGPGIAAKKVEITFWNGFTGPDGRYMQNLVDAFNKTYAGRIEVKMSVMPWGDYYTKVVAAVAAGNPPDVGIMHLDQIAAYVPRGVIIPLDDLAAELGLSEKDFIPAVWKAGIYEGKRYAIPLDIHPLVFYWNKKLFKEAGLDPEKPPRNRAEFIEFAKKLTKDKDGDGKIDQWGTMIPVGWPNFMIWYSIFFGNGGTLFTPDNKKALFNSPEGIDALQFLVDLVKVYKVSPENVAVDADVDAFKRGTCAMEFNGIWMLTAYQEQPGLEFGAGRVPQLGTKVLANWAGSHNFVVFRQRTLDPDKLSAAKTFIGWVSRKSLEWAKAGQLPARLSVLRSSDFKKIPYIGKLGQEIPQYVVFPPLFPKYGEATGPIWDALNFALTFKKDPKKALDDAVDLANKILASD